MTDWFFLFGCCPNKLVRIIFVSVSVIILRIVYLFVSSKRKKPSTKDNFFPKLAF